MRRLALVAFAALIAVYVVEAHRFFEQEQWARSAPDTIDPERLRHPEAAIGLARESLARFRYRRREAALIERALSAAPSFYEPPFLLATYHANRLERSDRVLRGYELSVARFPANGRLRYAYGAWLLDARGNLDVWEGIGDPLPRAETHLKAAMALEPELTWGILDALASARVPPERWLALVPEHPMAQAHLMDALFRAGRFELGLEMAQANDRHDAAQLQRTVRWALEGDRPDVAIAAAGNWLALVERERGAGTDSFPPARSLFRAHVANGDEASAYDALAAVQARIEAEHGTSSRVSLEFLCLMGDEYLRLQRRVTAESLYGEAHARSPSFVPALMGLARCAREEGDSESAEHRYREVLQLDPANPRARSELEALVLRRSGNRR